MKQKKLLKITSSDCLGQVSVNLKSWVILHQHAGLQTSMQAQDQSTCKMLV